MGMQLSMCAVSREHCSGQLNWTKQLRARERERDRERERAISTSRHSHRSPLPGACDFAEERLVLEP